MNDDELLADILSRLDRVVRRGGYWMACCPSHTDGTQSLKIMRGTQQPVIFHCHAGCDPKDVLAALDLSFAHVSSDAEPAPEQAQGQWTPHGTATAVYDYVDENGKLLFQVCRVPGKNFPQRAPDPSAKSGWRWRLGDIRRVLYRLPQVISGINEGRIVWVAEGEKDVASLEALGEVATCNPGGAGKWRPEYAEVLRDAVVIIIADADKPGRAHARAIFRSLEGIAAAAEIREAARGKDVSDHLGHGLALADLLMISDPIDDAQEPDLALDLNVFVAQPQPDFAWVIEGVMERADRLIWTGAEGLGKTMVTRQLAVCAAAGIHPFTREPMTAQRVLYLDCENPVRNSRKRFRALHHGCAQAGHPLADGMFHIVHEPVGLDLADGEQADYVLERVRAYSPDILAIGPLYKLHAADASEEVSARAIVRVLDLAVAICGSALIVEAHTPHGDKDRVLRPAGSSLFMRWPDLGMGIRRAHPEEKRNVLVKNWRGMRDERPGWPEGLTWSGTGMPWVPWKPDRSTAAQKKAAEDVRNITAQLRRDRG